MQLTSFDFTFFSNDDVIKGTCQSWQRKINIWGRGVDPRPLKKFRKLGLDFNTFSVTLHYFAMHDATHFILILHFFLTMTSSREHIKAA